MSRTGSPCGAAEGNTMHELGIVFNIIESVEQVAAENGIARVSTVTLELGEVSGIVPEYLADCWRWACSKKPLMDGCELVLEQVDALTFCEGCGETYATVAHGKTCPHCGSGKTYLVQGQEAVIKEITTAEAG